MNIDKVIESFHHPMRNGKMTEAKLLNIIDKNRTHGDYIIDECERLLSRRGYRLTRHRREGRYHEWENGNGDMSSTTVMQTWFYLEHYDINENEWPCGIPKKDWPKCGHWKQCANGRGDVGVKRICGAGDGR